MNYKIAIILLSGIVFCTAGCSTSHEVQVAPVEVKPIHITIDVNVKVDRALDSFFDEIDDVEDTLSE